MLKIKRFVPIVITAIVTSILVSSIMVFSAFAGGWSPKGTIDIDGHSATLKLFENKWVACLQGVDVIYLGSSQMAASRSTLGGPGRPAPSSPC